MVIYTVKSHIVSLFLSLSVQGSLCEDPETDTWSLDIEDLLRVSYQVAQGMDFLASKNVIEKCNCNLKSTHVV